MDADKLQELVDRQDIVDVLTRYATALDSRDWKLLTTCFTVDGVADYRDLGGLHEGPEAIVAICRNALGGLDASQHLLGNYVVELEGDTARSTCYLQAQHFLVSPTGSNTFLVGGIYRDEFVRTPEGWKIKHRTLEATWQDGNAGMFTEAAARLGR